SGMPVDNVSPFAMRTNVSLAIPFVALTPEEMQGSIQKIETALEGVAKTRGQVYEMVSSFTRVIVLRKTSTSPKSFMSWSSSYYIGRTCLVNAEGDWIDVVQLADALVHEAIHSFLFILEEKHPLIEDHAAANSIRVTSPWTGR